MPPVEELADQPSIIDDRAVWRVLPPLLKGYLRAGALVCGAPAFDAEFGTADLFVLLETSQMAARYQQHYLTA
jgi:L-ornithine Nalpha-acyltransferase